MRFNILYPPTLQAKIMMVLYATDDALSARELVELSEIGHNGILGSLTALLYEGLITAEKREDERNTFYRLSDTGKELAEILTAYYDCLEKNGIPKLK